MSISNGIRDLLNIQDTNISFKENCVMNGTYKGNSCKYVDGKLTYTPTNCVNSGIKNGNDTVTKSGTQKSQVTLPITGVQPTYLRLRKQRFVCKAYESSFTSKTPIVKKNCFISENKIAQVVIKSAEAQPLL